MITSISGVCQIVCHRYYTAKTILVTVYSLANKSAEMEQMLLACTPRRETDIGLSAPSPLGWDQVLMKHILVQS